MKKLIVYTLLFPLAVLGTACELQKSENILSPSIAGPIPGVEISAPKTLEPATGWQISGTQQPITLLLENSSSNSPRPMNYSFEVAADAGFSNKVFVAEGIEPGDNGRTAVRLPDALAPGRVYYWRAKAQDGANTGPYSAPAAFNLFTPVAFDPPAPLAPTNNNRTPSVIPEFRWANARHVGNPNYVAYAIEVGTTDSFASKLVAWQTDEGAGGETKLTAPTGFPSDTQLFWRVRAFEGGTIGPWSATAVFRTPVVIVAPPPPTGGGGGGGGVPPGAPCSSATSHLGVLECRKKQYGRLDRVSTYNMLVNFVRDLNTGNFTGKTFGVLKKGGGNACGPNGSGYSCDIVCNSSGQWWDVLYDWEGDQNPIWFYKGSDGRQNPNCELVR